MKFGFLTVEGQVPRRTRMNRVYWGYVCRCVCGRLLYIYKKHLLINGTMKSCGCKRNYRKRRVPLDAQIAKSELRQIKYRKTERFRIMNAAKGRRHRSKSRAREQYRLKTEPQYKLKKYLRKRLRSILVEAKQPKLSSVMNLVGCTITDLRIHLESKFVSGMSWKNYGLWHIDHIKPVSLFDLSNPEEQSACFHYSNLQPLWAIDNIRKHNHYP